MSIAQKLYALGELMSDNLESKGVTVDSDDTLKDMADKILTIPPATVGINLSSSLNLTASENIYMYAEFVLTATLTVFYDDTSQTNVDLHGILQGATVTFKNGQNNIIGSAITDSNGVATCNILCDGSSLEFYAVFDGTDDYSSSTSNHIIINPIYDFNLQFGRYEYFAFNGSAEISCKLTNGGVPIKNVTIGLLGSDDSVYSCITNSEGVGTVTINNLNSSITMSATLFNVTATTSITFAQYLLYDDASSDNTNTLFGDSIALRGGYNTVSWNNNGYYLIKNESNQKESMRVLAQLTGVYPSFCLEYDSYVEQIGGSSGFVVYNSSDFWAKLTDDSDSVKKYWDGGKHNGEYHEQAFYGNTTTYKRWVHYKYIFHDSECTMEVTEIDTGNIIVTRDGMLLNNTNIETKYGLDSEWLINTKTRYKNLVAYPI